MEQLTIDGMAQGRQLRDEGVAAVSANPANALWRVNAEDALTYLIATGRPFTAADVIERAGMPPTPNAVGALFIGAKKSGRIKTTGQWRKSPRAVSHARELREWVATR